MEFEDECPKTKKCKNCDFYPVVGFGNFCSFFCESLFERRSDDWKVEKTPWDYKAAIGIKRL